MIGEGEERVTLLQQKENNNNEFCNVIKNKIRQINRGVPQVWRTYN